MSSVQDVPGLARAVADLVGAAAPAGAAVEHLLVGLETVHEAQITP